jgi:hypothetical protein
MRVAETMLSAASDGAGHAEQIGYVVTPDPGAHPDAASQRLILA